VTQLDPASTTARALAVSHSKTAPAAAV